MSARAALRTITAPDHERVDRLFSRFDLSKTADYRLFLIAQASAHLPIEAALDDAGITAMVPDWPSRRRGHFLEEDLAELGVEPASPLPAPHLPGHEAVLGTLYVLEGSRLGGAVLKRDLSPGTPRRFLDARQEPGAWRSLLALLDQHLCTAERIELAALAAGETFKRFELAGQRLLGTMA